MLSFWGDVIVSEDNEPVVYVIMSIKNICYDTFILIFFTKSYYSIKQLFLYF